MLTQMSTMLILAGNTINLSGQWSKFWNAVKAAIGTQGTNLMAIIGVALVVFALGKWVWDRRRGGGGSNAGLIWMLVIGGILAAPDIIFPILLTITDWIVNTLIKVFGAAKG